MSHSLSDSVTALIGGLGVGEAPPPKVAAELMPLVYEELRGLARRYLRSERRDHTLQPTALVHEAYLKLVDQTRVSWQGRSHFRAIGAQAMRRILIDHAREQGAEKRGAGRYQVTLSGLPHAAGGQDSIDLTEVIVLEEALLELGELDPRQARALELRFYGDLPVAEIAEVLGVSKRTVEGDLAHGRAWLRRRLSRKGKQGGTGDQGTDG